MSRPKLTFLCMAMPIPEVVCPYIVKLDPSTTHLAQNTVCIEFVYPDIVLECVHPSRLGFLVYAMCGRRLSHLCLCGPSFLRFGN